MQWRRRSARAVACRRVGAASTPAERRLAGGVGAARRPSPAAARPPPARYWPRNGSSGSGSPARRRGRRACIRCSSGAAAATQVGRASAGCAPMSRVIAPGPPRRRRLGGSGRPGRREPARAGVRALPVAQPAPVAGAGRRRAEMARTSSPSVTGGPAGARAPGERRGDHEVERGLQLAAERGPDVGERRDPRAAAAATVERQVSPRRASEPVSSSRGSAVVAEHAGEQRSRAAGARPPAAGSTPSPGRRA